MQKIHRARISGGRIIFDNESDFLIEKSQLEGQEVDIILKKHRKNRSNNQNRYYWGCVIPLLIKHTGYTADEMHEIIKQLFFSREVEIAGHIVRIATTTKENTKEWEDKMSAIRSWASAELGVFVPEPNEVLI